MTVQYNTTRVCLANLTMLDFLSIGSVDQTRASFGSLPQEDLSTYYMRISGFVPLGRKSDPMNLSMLSTRENRCFLPLSSAWLWRNLAWLPVRWSDYKTIGKLRWTWVSWLKSKGSQWKIMICSGLLIQLILFFSLKCPGEGIVCSVRWSFNFFCPQIRAISRVEEGRHLRGEELVVTFGTEFALEASIRRVHLQEELYCTLD